MDFEYNGFDFAITERPDLCYLRTVHGHRDSDNKDFLPRLLFEQGVTVEKIKEVIISIMKGTFNDENNIEIYGNYNVYVGAG